MSPGSRRDAKTCSKRCRQAKARFRVRRAELEATDRSMHFAYADPPYPGLARKYYGCEEVDHAELVAHLVDNYPDGWALSTSSEALREVWGFCPAETRLCVWVGRTFRVRSLQALKQFECLLVFGGRPRHEAVVEDLCDALVWGGRQHSHPGALVGMKPAPFCEWMFRLLGASRGDQLDDLFPGSGAVGRAWRLYTSPPPGVDADPRDVSRLTVASRDASVAGPGDASRPDRAVLEQSSTVSAQVLQRSSDATW